MLLTWLGAWFEIALPDAVMFSGTTGSCDQCNLIPEASSQIPVARSSTVARWFMVAIQSLLKSILC
jgi:hypothetical protein